MHESEWLTEGHEWLGRRVMRTFGKKRQRYFLATIKGCARAPPNCASRPSRTLPTGPPPDARARSLRRRWVPEKEEGDLLLFHAVHDDGDEEDLEDFEVSAYSRATHGACHW